MHRSPFYYELTHPECTDLPLRLSGTFRRHNDHRQVKIHTADLLQDFDAIHSRQFKIKNNDIGEFSAIQFKSLPSSLSEEYFISQTHEEHLGECSGVFLIFNYENLGQECLLD
jgi:hypothetical protein